MVHAAALAVHSPIGWQVVAKISLKLHWSKKQYFDYLGLLLLSMTGVYLLSRENSF